MKNLLFLLVGFTTLIAFSKEKTRAHGAHAHGAGTLGIAFEGSKGKIDFKIPGESILGFEHKAKSDKDKIRQQEALAKLESKISDMIAFDSALNCVMSKDKIEVVSESARHSEVVAGFSIVCARSPVGSEVTFNFQKQFPKIKELDVAVIADNVQKSIEVKTDNTKLSLK